MNRADIQDLFAYTDWANDRVLDACAQLADAEWRADRKISHGSIAGTLTHMAGAEWVWLERWLGRSPAGDDVWSQWLPERWRDVPSLRARWQTIASERQALLRDIGEGDLQSVRTFRRIDGSVNALPLIQQMQHTVNHATLHRGQVVGMLRQLGHTPPNTDLLGYYRHKTGQ